MNLEDMTPEEQAQTAAWMQQMSEQFEELCFARHVAGQQEYGEFTFLQNDVIRMMCEELADTANYARYQFIKLMILQERLNSELSDQNDKLEELGINTFRGTGKAWQDANRPDTTD